MRYNKKANSYKLNKGLIPNVIIYRHVGIYNHTITLIYKNENECLAHWKFKAFVCKTKKNMSVLNPVHMSKKPITNGMKRKIYVHFIHFRNLYNIRKCYLR